MSDQTSIKELYNLDGKVAFITGGARHLGFDAAATLAEAGCSLVITSRKLENANAAAKELESRYRIEALPQELDVCNYDQVAEVIGKVHRWKGKMDILVNNAGGNVGGPTHLFERRPEDMVQLIMTNLVGSLYCCKEAGRIMAGQGSGKIINIASIAGMIGRDRRMYERSEMGGQPVDYAAAKAGVIGMTKDLAGLLSPEGVHVNAISPGGFGPRELPEGFVRDYSDRTPLGRMGHDKKDLKGAILFLASEASDYVTGQNLVVDGGFTIWH
jgi:NAD(P)-dependent dehydrogenase (short-subunit alcohol dehydrogenase family)